MAPGAPASVLMAALLSQVRKTLCFRFSPSHHLTRIRSRTKRGSLECTQSCPSKLDVCTWAISPKASVRVPAAFLPTKLSQFCRAAAQSAARVFQHRAGERRACRRGRRSHQRRVDISRRPLRFPRNAQSSGSHQRYEARWNITVLSLSPPPPRTPKPPVPMSHSLLTPRDRYGVPLKVSRPHDYVPPTDAPAPHALLAALTGPTAAAAFAAPVAAPDPSSTPPSRFMAVTNVLCADDLVDRKECGYIADDTRKKFNADFGSVLAVRVVLGTQPNVDSATQQVIAPFVGTILVEFADVSTAELAKTRMVGFKFAMRSVTSRYIDGMTWGTIMTSGDCIEPIEE
jgi:hypothetical protein